MRESRSEPQISVTMALLIANGVGFVAEYLAWGYPPDFSRDQYFALSIEGLRHGYVWELLTFQFMHAGLMHLFMNCWVIYLFGRELEATLGRNRFLALYLSSGVVGGLFQALAGVLAQHYWMGTRWEVFTAGVVGASAGGMGLLAAYATLFPERALSLLLLPVDIPAKIVLLLGGVVTVLGIIFPDAGPFKDVANVAHLGGLVTGIFFVRSAMNWQWPQLHRVQRAPRRLVRVPSQKSGIWGSRDSTVEEDMSADEFLRREVDPILDKISAHGIQSLTEKERRVLEAARAKMAKR